MLAYMAPAPLKLRPYGAIQICLLLLLVVVVCQKTSEAPADRYSQC